MKRNCWELKACGRQQGGEKVAQMGICPAAIAKDFHGLNNGQNGGRSCWAVAGTFCGGKVQGTFAEKRASCLSCEIYAQIRQEEGAGFMLTPSDRGYAGKKAS